jgi:hypothetical protein
MITTLKALVVYSTTTLLFLTSHSMTPVNAAPRAGLLRVGTTETVGGSSKASAAIVTTLAPPSATTEGSDDQRILWNEDFAM